MFKRKSEAYYSDSVSDEALSDAIVALFLCDFGITC